MKTLDRLIDYLFRTVVPDDYPFSGADDRAVPRHHLVEPARLEGDVMDCGLDDLHAFLPKGPSPGSPGRPLLVREEWLTPA